MHLQAALLLLHGRGLGFPVGLLLLAGEHEVVGLDLREMRLQAVVIGLAERVELMIVAARAAHRDAEERGAHDVGHLGEHFVVGAGDVLVAGVLAQRAEAVEAAGDEEGRVLRIDLVAGELLFDEFVVGLVAVETLHHVVAIAPGVGAVHVVLVAVALGEADDVEPVAAPLFAVVRRGQQTVDDFLPGVGRFVGEEGVDLFGSGRQAGEVEGDAADERGAVGGRRGFQSGFLESGQQEGVDGRLRPGFVGRGGEGRGSGIFSGLEGPVAALSGRVYPEGRNWNFGGGQHQCRAENRYEALHP